MNDELPEDFDADPLDGTVDEYVDEEPAEPVHELAEDSAVESPATASTGHPAVDEVLRSLGALGDLPVDEHVAVFEQAHEDLRRTLSGAGDQGE
jgi:hypothetical protein